jgi:hypothetical protein
MFALAPLKFWAKKTPCKKLADLHPRQGNLLQRYHFQGSAKPLFTWQNRVEISWTNYSLFQTCFF